MAHSKGALFAALTIACLLALGIGQADAQRLSGLRGFLTRLGTRQHQGEATFAAENEGGAAKEGHTLSTSRYSSLDKSDTLMDLTDSSYARVVPLQDELPNYSSWTICPDSVSLSADVTHASAIGSPLFLTNGTQAGQIAELGREVIHGRHCLLSTLNAYSHSEKRYANLMKSYEALVSEKENLEGQLREKQQGRMERILLWTVIICGVTCFLARSKVGAALTFLSRAIGGRSIEQIQSSILALHCPGFASGVFRSTNLKCLSRSVTILLKHGWSPLQVPVRGLLLSLDLCKWSISSL